MSQIKQNLFALPNVNVPLQQGDFVNPTWYLFFNKLSALGGQDETGVSSIAAGPGLSTDPTSAGTITSSGTLYLNLDYYGTTEGTLLFRGPAAWEGLGPGEPGTYLESNGAGAAPSWAPVDEILPSVNPGDVLGNNGTAAGPAQDVTLSSILDIAVGSAQGMIVFRGATQWQALDTGLPNQVLTSGGPGQDVFWADAGPAFTDRYMAAVLTIGGTRTVLGISTDGTQNSGLATGVGA